ncbi:nitroreductase family deazaflavin-dependent oxidoreductase [Mycolicibacterium rufum]|uniref:Nitroreductase family deazaflavin-dependent oxidoreductase n=2 Tax=Mycolicibacterium rufum TaxID=318424 RepID=A0ABY3UAK2_9MYCO|nr:nitroreductase family deazaflavin-dependent oxidoreductase [Mycolicibacterium rufum]ULP35522.1 nitroreductase family deazaflavin-dependent oxidoreductase [Mycolicibacterium rufum]
MRNTVQVVICGAGIAGLTLANRLANSGAHVVLLERCAGPRSQGYMIDFFGLGYDAADAMGLIPELSRIAYDIDHADLVDERGQVHARARAKQFTSGPLLDVMRPDLERVLRESLPSAVDLRFGSALAAVTDLGTAVRVTLGDGSRIDADLLVGADGLHSTVRRLMFGRESDFLRHLGFHTAAWTFSDPAIHAAVAGRFCLTDTIDRQVGLYPLRGDGVAAFAVHRSADEELADDPRAALRRVYGGLGWLVPAALDRCPPDPYYDQVAQIVMPRWSVGRVALLGDACCAVSLLAGQGASLAVAGACVLADQLVKATPIEQAFARYETLWRPVAEGKQKAGRSAARWVLPSTVGQLWLRRAMLRATRFPLVDAVVARVMVGRPGSMIDALNAADSRRNPVAGTRLGARIMKVVFRAPTWLYDNGFGWALGQRFLCLTHRGRTSRRRYRTVLEVIGRDPAADEYLVIAGFGRTADWYRNIEANPEAGVTVGRHHFAARHRVLTESEAESAVAAYERAHRAITPVIRRVLSRLLGWRYDGSEAARRRLAAELPVVALRPLTGGRREDAT